MDNAVIVTTELPPAQAQALMDLLIAHYRESFSEHWYADQFSLIAAGQRHEAILAHVPIMAAQKSLIGALSHGLKKAIKQS
ncbi:MULTISPECIES: hypothetical protein [Pseudomonas syringae group]|uniref:Uncharacterized protein n=1 Tax=Pseudomonas syringae pv. syringae TaxID=321 RepID=A0AB35JH22_PSESY|nr:MULTISPECIES: hypothetical protein [Pseudomonas syringae group]MBI6720945.1 hypothetical protein [Pseudomonas syringae]MBI6742278.1 hypothetical protein [Pseudomonas syringae]MBI6747295.1 hypothetical protein [Pseudomonas syringae]MBI6750038.1 hypothetical protein [Pseudomonas syringae]MBI6755342.1 hypothetical protein [Pseudomonas syringae]